MNVSLQKLPLDINVKTSDIYENLNKASRALGELKGESKTIPNEEILINTLALHELRVSRKTASSYLNQLSEDGFVKKMKIKNSNYYVNLPLFTLFADEE